MNWAWACSGLSTRWVVGAEVDVDDGRDVGRDEGRDVGLEPGPVAGRLLGWLLGAVVDCGQAGIARIVTSTTTATQADHRRILMLYLARQMDPDRPDTDSIVSKRPPPGQRQRHRPVDFDAGIGQRFPHSHALVASKEVERDYTD